MAANEIPKIGLDKYKYDFKNPEDYYFRVQKGLSREVVQTISEMKNEPDWMRQIRLRALEIYNKKPIPKWGGNLDDIDFDDIYYYIKPAEKMGKSWDDIPRDIRETFDKLGIPEAEQKYLSGVGAQYESEAVYHSLRENLKKQGVIFLDMDSGLKQYPDLVREYFGTVVPTGDNKFSAMNTAVWSGGSFVYIPEGVHVDIPLQAYFRINARNMGQFERSLIIAEPGSYLHYIEGCTAPIYSEDSLHSGVIEIIVKKGARIRYTTIQNWAPNVYNLVTQRAVVYEDAAMEWVDGNIGSKLTMKYPAVILKGRGARGEILSMSYAGKGQHQDAGAKAVHLAPDTSSNIISKSISSNGGRASYRGLVKVSKNADRVKSNTRCDALILDDISRSDTYPYMEVDNATARISHEATVSKIGDEQLFYLQSRGLKENEAMALIVRGFMESIVKELPMEYAVELNRLIELQMDGSIG